MSAATEGSGRLTPEQMADYRWLAGLADDPDGMVGTDRVAVLWTAYESAVDDLAKATAEIERLRAERTAWRSIGDSDRFEAERDEARRQLAAVRVVADMLSEARPPNHPRSVAHRDAARMIRTALEET